jgi:DNA polymerase-3 subunit delta
VKIQAKQLASALGKSLAPCYLVSGDEHLLVGEALDCIRDAARAAGFTSRELHVATTGFDWNQLKSASGNLSLFAEKRIIELRLPTGKPGVAGAKTIVEMAALHDPDLLFIVSTPKLDRSGAASKWAKSLDSAGVSVQIWPVDLRDLPGWIADRMRQQGLQPDRAASMLIADRVEGNLLAASQEIEKLRLLLGEGKVTAEDVSDAVANSTRYDVYKLADAALSGDARRTLKILMGLRAEGVEPVIVMWSLTRELRTLARLDDAVRQGQDLASGMQKAGVWRNRQALFRSCVGRHQPGDFHKLLKLARDADAAAKGQSSRDPWQLATEIILGLTVGQRRAA